MEGALPTPAAVPRRRAKLAVAAVLGLAAVTESRCARSVQRSQNSIFRFWSSELGILDLQVGFYINFPAKSWILRSGHLKVSEKLRFEISIFFIRSWGFTVFCCFCLFLKISPVQEAVGDH